MTYIARSMIEFSFNKKTTQFQLVIESIETLCSTRILRTEYLKKTKREKENEAKESLIQHLHPKSHLFYNSYGAPYLSNGKAVSLSHSIELLAYISANKLAAVDLEPITFKAYQIRHKFLSQEELNIAEDYKIATLMWCAKECLYKIYQRGKLIFNEDLKIHNILENQIECSLLNKYYNLNYEKFKEHWVVYYFD